MSDVVVRAAQCLLEWGSGLSAAMASPLSMGVTVVCGVHGCGCSDVHLRQAGQ